MPTNSNYKIQFKLEGGARVTKTILASSEGDAAAKAVKQFKAKEVLKIKKVN
jgi:hypothetical protein